MTTESQNSRDVRELGYEVAHALDQENASGWVLRRRFIEARAIRAQSVALTGYGTLSERLNGEAHRRRVR